MSTVYTPTSEQSNAAILQHFNNSFNECIQTETEYFLWLGIKPGENNTWIYSNNRSTIMYYHDLSFECNDKYCGMLRTDGHWKVRHKNLCPKYQLCFICLFEQEPIFTLRGLTCFSSYYDFTFYLSPTLKGIELIGYKKSKIREEDFEWRLGWDINGHYGNLSKNVTSLPLGRHSWYISDTICREGNANQTLTFSVCNFRKDFTCRSGQCVDLSKQCDQFNDCLDASDEVNCTTIHPKANYSPLEPLQGWHNPLWTTVKILQFDEVDTLKMHLTLTREVKIQWYDEGINLANLNSERSVNHSDITG